eukprot:TRINITY_DN11954_c0_g1_i1.p1 TRINITY_DN11954_c0_g1~~TRINITY_DN11954_c0_g1_i1.p1  ORF type:complete len:296 (-),score=90.63 TRINITY_DN11954_c0_g1_i1:46-933(-)
MSKSHLTDEQKSSWKENGFLLVPQLFDPERVSKLRDHFMSIQREAQSDLSSPLRAKYAPLSSEESGGDVLKEYPRVMHPHKWDELSKEQMLNGNVQKILSELMGEEALAAQSMFYFKPMGARGQALHQDNFYLNVKPGTCVAAWLAVDDADQENGGMSMVPGSHNMGIQCPEMADMSMSFSTELVRVPNGFNAVPANMKAGDVLFFNGSVIHGSGPNSSKDRFRRAFICHYVPNSTIGMNGGYFPLTKFNGETLTREAYEGQLNTCGAEDWDTYTKLKKQFEKDHDIASGAGNIH